MNPHDKLTDVQKAFYEGYDKGWSERGKEIKDALIDLVFQIEGASKDDKYDVLDSIDLDQVKKIIENEN